MSSNKKRSRGNKIQSIKYYRYETKGGKKVRIEIASKPKQLHLPMGFPQVDQKLSDMTGRETTHFNMVVSYAGEGELEGVIEIPEVIVHASNRATLIRKAARVLTEKHGFRCPVISIPAPSKRIEGIVL